VTPLESLLSGPNWAERPERKAMPQYKGREGIVS
jgi:hypothetical protein